MTPNTETHKYECPEGDCFVKIADIDGKLWIDAAVGHAGSPVLADAQAICALAGIAIRHGTPPIKVAHALKGVSHENSNHLLARNGHNIGLSVADAIGDTIWRTLC